MSGDKEYHEFAKWVCPSLTDSDIAEIARHMDRFDDWPESYLLNSIIDYLSLSDEQFMFFLEQYVNPNIHHWRWNDEEERRELMSTLYGVDVRTINEHIKKIYSDSELEEDATIRNFRIVQTEGSRQVARDTKRYNL